MGATIKGLEGIGYPFGGYGLATFMDGVNYNADGDKLALVDMKHSAGSYNYGYIRYEATEDTTLVITLDNNVSGSGVVKWSAVYVNTSGYRPSYNEIVNGSEGNGKFIYRTNQSTSNGVEQCSTILEKGMTYYIAFITAYSSSSAAGGSNDKFRIHNIMFVPVNYRGTGKYGCAIHNVDMRKVLQGVSDHNVSSRLFVNGDIQHDINRNIVVRILYRDKGELKQCCGINGNNGMVWPDGSWSNKLNIALRSIDALDDQTVTDKAMKLFVYDVQATDMQFVQTIEAIQFLYYGYEIVDYYGNRNHHTVGKNALIYNFEHEPEKGSSIRVAYERRDTSSNVTYGVVEFIVGESSTETITSHTSGDDYIEYNQLTVRDGGRDRNFGWCFQVVAGNDETSYIKIVEIIYHGTCYDRNWVVKQYHNEIDSSYYDRNIWSKHLYYGYDKKGVAFPYYVDVKFTVSLKHKQADSWTSESSQTVRISNSSKINYYGSWITGAYIYSKVTKEKIGNINFIDGYFQVSINPNVSSNYEYRITLDNVQYTVYYDGDTNQKMVYGYDSRWNIDISDIKVTGNEQIQIVLPIEYNENAISGGQRAPHIRYLVDGIEKSWYPEWNGQQQASSDGYVKFDGYKTYTLVADGKTVQGVQIQRVWGYEIPYIVDPDNYNNKVEVYSKGRMNDKFIEAIDLYRIVVVQTYFETDMQRPGLASIDIDERYLPPAYEDRDMSHYIPVAIYWTDNFVAHPDSSQYYNLSAFHMESVVKQNDQASDMYYASPTYYLSKDWEDPDKYVWTFEWYVHDGGSAQTDIAVQIVFLKVK